MPPDVQRNPDTVLVLTQLTGLEELRVRVPKAMAETTRCLEALLDAQVQAMGGRRARCAAVGRLSLWSDVASAVGFATRLQEVLLSGEWPATLLVRPEAQEVRSDTGTLLFRGPRLRTVVHVGRVSTHQGPAVTPVVGGAAVYHIGRVIAALQPGQTVLTRRARSALGAMRSPLHSHDLGEHRFLGYVGTESLLLVQPESLGERPILPVRSRVSEQTNAPPPRPGFYGRDGDLHGLGELFRLGVRAVTLTGPAGAGKTRLLQRCAWMLRNGVRRGTEPSTWLCRVQGGTHDHVIQGVASALGLSLRTARSRSGMLDQIAHELVALGSVVLLIDAGSGEPEALRETLEYWLRRVPELRTLVAAGSPLGVHGEVVYRLKPLSAADPSSARNADAVRLFVDRARRVQPEFRADDPETLAWVVNHMGGLPLSIGFVAGMMGQLSLGEIASLVGTTTGEPEAVLQLVWDHLSPQCQSVLQIWAAFPSAFDGLAAASLIPTELASQLDPGMVDRLFRRGLLNKVDDPTTPETRRLRMDRRLRAIALASLEDAERLELQRRWADQLLAMVEPWANEAWGQNGPELLARLQVEWASLSALIAWGSREDAPAEDVNRALRSVALLWPLTAVDGPASLFVRQVSAVVERASNSLEADPILLSLALHARAEAWRNSRKWERAERDARRAADMARQWGEHVCEGLALWCLAMVRAELGELSESTEMMASATACFEGRHAGFAAAARGRWGAFLAQSGDTEQGRQFMDESVERLRKLGWQRHLGLVLHERGCVRRSAGELDGAAADFRTASTVFAALADLRALAACVVEQSVLELSNGQEDAAEARLVDILHTCRVSGDRLAEARVHRNLALVALLRHEGMVARAELLSALAIERELGDATASATSRLYLAVAAHLDRDLARARAGYDEVLAQSSDEDSRVRAMTTVWVALALTESGERAAAQQQLKSAREQSVRCGFRALSDLAELCEVCVGSLEGGQVSPGAANAVQSALKSSRIPGAESRLVITHLKRMVGGARLPR